MPSISSNPIRVAPQQERSTRRLAGFLKAAAELFVEAGYEAATMTALAERSGSSIGALYNYFPDKQSIAFTLVNQYSQEMEAHWKEQSLLAANVSLQIVRGMMTLYGEADSKGKVLVVAEFKKVLTLYLGSVLSKDAVLAK